MEMEQQTLRLQQFLSKDRVVLPPRSPNRVTNDVSDIDGARPLLKDHVFTHKPHFYDPQDIRGSSSKQLHPTHRHVGDDDRFKQLPVEGSWSDPARFKTKRVVNPLMPEYRLPSFKSAPPLEPKFLRDSYNVSDIEGTRFNPRVVNNPRHPMRLDDLPGSQTGWLPRNKRALYENPPRDTINVNDITGGDYRSSRITNVLNPVYTVNGMTHQDDELTRPIALHPNKNKPHYALITSDIEGASCTDPGKSIVAGIVNEKRRHFRPINRTDDITGAKADTLLHSIHSERCSDPNDPTYVALEGGARVDSTAVAVGRNIVFASMIQQQENLAAVIAAKMDKRPAPYIVSSVGNVGLASNPRNSNQQKEKPRKSTPSGQEKPPLTKRTSEFSHVTRLSMRSAGDVLVNKSNSISSTSRTERRQAQSRLEEIQSVRDLS